MFACSGNIGFGMECFEPLCVPSVCPLSALGKASLFLLKACVQRRRSVHDLSFILFSTFISLLQVATAMERPRVALIQGWAVCRSYAVANVLWGFLLFFSICFIVRWGKKSYFGVLSIYINVFFPLSFFLLRLSMFYLIHFT